MRQLRFFKSLKFRIFLALFLIGILPQLALRMGTLYFYEERAVSARSIEILSYVKILGNQILTYDYLEDPTNDQISGELELVSNIYDGRVLVIDDSLQIVKDTYNIDTGKTIISEGVIKSLRGEENVTYHSKEAYLEMTIPLTDTATGEVKGVMVVSVSTDAIVTQYEYLQGKIVLIENIFNVVIFLISVLLALLLVRPVGQVAKSMDRIQRGEEEPHLSVSIYTETDAISVAFNENIRRMQLVDRSRQEFVSNVSHELKTPLTSMKVLADSLLAQEDAPAELYREFLVDIADEIERENKIINDLLSLVKMDRSAAVMNIETLSMNELLELILKRLTPIAEKQRVELVLESFRPVTAEVDEVKISLAISNLVENAIKYNKEGGWVHVSLNADYKYFYLRVEDNGIGIPADSLDHIFEQFYRVDKSHSREIGGTGLGLAITRNSILMHHGSVKVHSVEGEGTIFTVRIPLNYIA